MLQYLNQIAFAPFGKILKSNFEGTPHTIQKTDTDVFFYYSEDIFLNIVEGVCALSLIEQGKVCSFLLDKPIRLKAGVPFCLTAVGGSCVIKLLAEGKRHSIPYRGRFSPIQRTPKIFISDIITFFYQEKAFGLRPLPETHDFFELTYVDSGTIINQLDGKNFIAHQGELLFFFPGQTHMQTTPDDGPVSFVTISFAMRLENATLLKDKIFRADAVIRSIYSNILTEYESPDGYSADMLVGYLHQIILRLMRYSIGMSPHSLPADPQNTPDSSTPEPSLIKGNISNPLVHSAIDYIHTHVQKRLSLSDVAEALKLNPSYISRLFKAHTNWNMTEYIRVLKLSKAKKLLKSGGYTVTELSELFGFSSIHYFSSCFKKQYGIAPGHYAQMLKE